jgi:tetratricopeptide (TPR) repeat protein
MDRSLLRVNSQGRYAMHPLVQQFAAEKLAEAPAPFSCQAHDRHALLFAALTHRREGDFHGAQDQQALAWMISEAENIRAAWRWAVQQVNVALLEQFLESFLYFFDFQGCYQECVDLTSEALQVLHTARHECDISDQDRCLGRLLALRAAFQFRLGAFEEARQGAEKALALLEPLRPLREVGHARLYLGAAWYGLGDLNRSVRWFLAASEAYEEAGHAWGVGATLDNAGYLEFLRGDIPAAEAHMKRGLEIARQTGSRYLLTGVYDHLATLMTAQHRFAEAMTYVERCREVLDQLDRPYIVASLSLSLSQIAVQAGDYEAAASYLTRALELARMAGNRLDIVKTLIQLAGLQVTRGNLAAAERTLRAAATVGREIHAESLLVDVAAGLADLAAAKGQHPTGIVLYRFVQGHPAASQETVRKATDGLRQLSGTSPGVDPAGERLSLDAALVRGLAAI